MPFCKPTDKSNWPAPESLVERNTAGESWTSIAKSLHVTRKVVQLYVSVERSGGCTANQRNTIIARDNAFVTLMTKAIEAGRENATVGILVDTTPSYARSIQAPAVFSACGSPSAMCMEAAGTDGAEIGYA